MRGEKNRLGGAELHTQSQTELLLLLSLSEQLKHDSTGFILVYEAFLVALQEKCIIYHMTKTPSLFGELDRMETHHSLPLLIDLIREPPHALHKYIHYESSSMVRLLPEDSSRKIRNAFGTTRKSFSGKEQFLFKYFQMSETFE